MGGLDTVQRNVRSTDQEAISVVHEAPDSHFISNGRGFTSFGANRQLLLHTQLSLAAATLIVFVLLRCFNFVRPRRESCCKDEGPHKSHQEAPRRLDGKGDGFIPPVTMCSSDESDLDVESDSPMSQSEDDDDDQQGAAGGSRGQGEQRDDRADDDEDEEMDDGEDDGAESFHTAPSRSPPGSGSSGDVSTSSESQKSSDSNGGYSRPIPLLNESAAGAGAPSRVVRTISLKGSPGGSPEPALTPAVFSSSLRLSGPDVPSADDSSPSTSTAQLPPAMPSTSSAVSPASAGAIPKTRGSAWTAVWQQQSRGQTHALPAAGASGGRETDTADVQRRHGGFHMPPAQASAAFTGGPAADPTAAAPAAAAGGRSDNGNRDTESPYETPSGSFSYPSASGDETSSPTESQKVPSDRSVTSVVSTHTLSPPQPRPPTRVLRVVSLKGQPGAPPQHPLHRPSTTPAPGAPEGASAPESSGDTAAHSAAGAAHGEGGDDATGAVQAPSVVRRPPKTPRVPCAYIPESDDDEAGPSSKPASKDVGGGAESRHWYVVQTARSVPASASVGAGARKAGNRGDRSTSGGKSRVPRRSRHHGGFAGAPPSNVGGPRAKAAERKSPGGSGDLRTQQTSAGGSPGHREAPRIYHGPPADIYSPFAALGKPFQAPVPGNTKGKEERSRGKPIGAYTPRPAGSSAAALAQAHSSSGGHEAATTRAAGAAQMGWQSTTHVLRGLPTPYFPPVVGSRWQLRQADAKPTTGSGFPTDDALPGPSGLHTAVPRASTTAADAARAASSLASAPHAGAAPGAGAAAAVASGFDVAGTGPGGAAAFGPDVGFSPIPGSAASVAGASAAAGAVHPGMPRIPYALPWVPGGSAGHSRAVYGGPFIVSVQHSTPHNLPQFGAAGTAAVGAVQRRSGAPAGRPGRGATGTAVAAPADVPTGRRSRSRSSSRDHGEPRPRESQWARKSGFGAPGRGSGGRPMYQVPGPVASTSLAAGAAASPFGATLLTETSSHVSPPAPEPRYRSSVMIQVGAPQGGAPAAHTGGELHALLTKPSTLHGNVIGVPHTAPDAAAGAAAAAAIDAGPSSSLSSSSSSEGDGDDEESESSGTEGTADPRDGWPSVASIRALDSKTLGALQEKAMSFTNPWDPLHVVKEKLGDGALLIAEKLRRQFDVENVYRYQWRMQGRVFNQPVAEGENPLNWSEDDVFLSEDEDEQPEQTWV